MCQTLDLAFSMRSNIIPKGRTLALGRGWVLLTLFRYHRPIGTLYLFRHTRYLWYLNFKEGELIGGEES